MLMGARWFEPAADGQTRRLWLPDGGEEPRALVDAALENRRLLRPGSSAGNLELECGNRRLGASDLATICRRLQEDGHSVVLVVSANPFTRVAAAALGLGWLAMASEQRGSKASPEAGLPATTTRHENLHDSLRHSLTLHRGTVRSGDQLEAAGSLLVLGDVNPGGQVRAVGHVLVWGRLRGVAQAGCLGDREARIVALQLRPLQLKIADVLARGPEDPPPAGLVEEARLVDGAIRIAAAGPVWPLSG